MTPGYRLVRTVIRLLLWLFTDGDLHRRLLQERRALADEARALGDLVPPHAG